MNDKNYLDLPFPYFYLSPTLEILNTSITDKTILGITFIDLLLDKSAEKFHRFLYQYPDSDAELFCVDFSNGKPSLQKIFKTSAGNGHFHLFCHPQEFTKESEQFIAQKHQIEILKRELEELTLQVGYSGTIRHLAASIAHEIRNPLTTIKGFIQLLQPYLITIDKEDYAEIALDEIERVNEIIYQFLNAAKPKENKVETISLNKLLTDIDLLYESEAKMRNISIITNLAAEDSYVVISENYMKQVLINLLKNAFEAIESSSQTNGEIKLSSSINGDVAIIGIEDNGCGMSPETMQSIFTQYYSTKATGTGLGLSLCKKIIDEHGGNISITSQLGIGSAFKIELPRSALTSNYTLEKKIKR